MKKFLTLIMLMSCLAAWSQRLWKVTPATPGVAPSYIFGTHHLVTPEYLPASAREALDSASVVVGEVVVSELNGDEGREAIMKATAAPPDSSLTSLFTPQQIDSINALFNILLGTGQVPFVQQQDDRCPGVLSAALTMFLGEKVLPGFSTGGNIDTYVQEYARSCGKELRGLESADEQLSLLYGSSVASQAAELMEMVRDPRGNISKLEEMTQYYLDGDLESLYTMLDEPVSGVGTDELERLVVNRNRAWMWTLDQIIGREGNAFIAVGAGHLPSETGILAMLESRGYIVTPVE